MNVWGQNEMAGYVWRAEGKFIRQALVTSKIKNSLGKTTPALDGSSLRWLKDIEKWSEYRRCRRSRNFESSGRSCKASEWRVKQKKINIFLRPSWIHPLSLIICLFTPTLRFVYKVSTYSWSRFPMLCMAA